jgi:putative addiction module killer protein
LTTYCSWSNLSKLKYFADGEPGSRIGARALIASRLDRLAFGNAGNVRPVGEGVSELRIDHGPGYRIYFQQRGKTIALLLCGGDKRTQDRDIEIAKRLAREWRETDA